MPRLSLLFPPRVFLTFLLLSGLIVALTACGAPGASRSATPAPTEPTLAPPLPASYAALGASETYGMGAAPHTKGYAYLVAHVLGARHFVDTGIPGTTLDAGYDTELTDALAIRPSLCTVFFGFNDLRSGVQRGPYLRDLRDLVGALRQAHAQVLIIGLPDVSLLPAVRKAQIGGVRAIITSWNSGMATVARRTGAHFLDLSQGQFNAELAAHPNYISSDGLHPSNLGYARLAQIVAAAIRHDGLWRTR